MQVKVGSRLRSAVCSTEVIVVRAPAGELALTCGGAPMLGPNAEAGGGDSLDPSESGGTALGKRYASDALGLELLVTKAGEGALSVDGTKLELKDAKSLPSSD